jgi:hypothetical protein
MYLCTCVSEEGGDGEAVCSETPSLLSYTLRDVSFTYLCTCVSEEVGDREGAEEGGDTSNVL